MRRIAAAMLVAAVGVATAACTGTPPGRQYELTGQILEVRPDRDEVVIKHQDIKGFMPGMTMPFKVRPASLLGGRKPGELVTATLVVEEVDAYLSVLTRTGEAALPESTPVPEAPKTLQPGDPVPDAALVDETGKPVFVSSFKGRPLALTFIYTRCPIPDFCPLMDRHFKTIQEAVQRTPALAKVKLLTVTLDPAFDTPAVLKPYAAMRGADPAIWSFLTGDVAEVAKFGEQFGLYIEHDAKSSLDIIHNLRTAVVDASGRVVTIHNGNAWTTAEIIAELTTASATPSN
jgi:protein SCO1/2